MKRKLKRLTALILSLVLVLSMAQTAVADTEAGESLSAGTYSVPVTLDDYVSAMSVDFGGVLADTATAVIGEDGTVSLTLTFQTMTITIGSDYVAWIDDFYGYYEDGTLTSTDLAIVTTTITDENGAEQTAVLTATFTASSVEDTYDLSYYLMSNVMPFTRNKTITLDWENAVCLSSSEESSEDTSSQDESESGTTDTDNSGTTDSGAENSDTTGSDTESSEENDASGDAYGFTLYYKCADSTSAYGRYFGRFVDGAYESGTVEAAANEDGTYALTIVADGSSAALTDVAMIFGDDVTYTSTTDEEGYITYVLTLESLEETIDFQFTYTIAAMGRTNTHDFQIVLEGGSWSGHDYVAGEADEDGIVTYTCSRCGDSYSAIEYTLTYSTDDGAEWKDGSRLATYFGHFVNGEYVSGEVEVTENEDGTYTVIIVADGTSSMLSDVSFTPSEDITYEQETDEAGYIVTTITLDALTDDIEFTFSYTISMMGMTHAYLYNISLAQADEDEENNGADSGEDDDSEDGTAYIVVDGVTTELICADYVDEEGNPDFTLLDLTDTDVFEDGEEGAYLVTIGEETQLVGDTTLARWVGTWEDWQPYIYPSEELLEQMPYLEEVWELAYDAYIAAFEAVGMGDYIKSAYPDVDSLKAYWYDMTSTNGVANIVVEETEDGYILTWLDEDGNALASDSYTMTGKVVNGLEGANMYVFTADTLEDGSEYKYFVSMAPDMEGTDETPIAAHYHFQYGSSLEDLLVYGETYNGTTKNISDKYWYATMINAEASDLAKYNVILGMHTAEKWSSLPDEEDDTLAAGIYEVTVGLRNASNTANASGAAAVMDTTGYLTVDEDGGMTLTLFFPDDAVVMGLAAHATGIDVYEEDGETLMSVEYTQYETDLYTSLMGSDTEEGYAISRADISLSYVAEDGLYSAYIYSDRMSATVALYVDFDSAVAVDEIPEDTGEEAVTYTGTATVDGYDYDLTVEVTVEDGVITAVTVSSEEVYSGSHNGSIIYYEDAVEVLTETLIGVSADKDALEAVDTVSGATMTADAIIEAVLAALGLDEDNDALDLSLTVGAVYSVDITYKAAAHSLVSDPEATADDDSDTVSALIVVDTDGHASIVIDLYNSEAMYITSYNGLHLGGSEDGELSTDGAVVYTEENDELQGGTYVTQVTIPLDDLYSVYYTSVSVYVPDMYNVDMDGDGEIDEGYFTVDPSTLTIDWDSLTLVEYTSDDEEYDYAEDAVLGFHTVSAEYAGTGDFEGMDRVLYAIDKYLGDRVGVEELEDGTWNVIVYFGGEYGYNSAIGDLTVYESEDMSDEGTVLTCGEDQTYVIHVDSLEDPIYVSLYVGGSMDLTVTYSITLNASDYQGHSYELTATDEETGAQTYTCTVCGDSYTEEMTEESTEETTEELTEETTEEPTEETTEESTEAIEESAETSEETLTSLVATITALTQGSYTSDSWTALQSALAAAQAVLADEDATEEEIAAALTALVAAQAALVTTEETTTTEEDTTATSEDTTSTAASDTTTTTASETTTAAASTTTAASTSSSSTETGDSSNLMLYAAILLIALGASLTIAGVSRKKRF